MARVYYPDPVHQAIIKVSGRSYLSFFEFNFIDRERMVGQPPLPPRISQAMDAIAHRYATVSMLEIVREVEQRIPWHLLARETNSGITKSAEYKALWRHLVYGYELPEEFVDADEANNEGSQEEEMEKEKEDALSEILEKRQLIESIGKDIQFKQEAKRAIEAGSQKEVRGLLQVISKEIKDVESYMRQQEDILLVKETLYHVEGELKEGLKGSFALFFPSFRAKMGMCSFTTEVEVPLHDKYTGNLTKRNPSVTISLRNPSVKQSDEKLRDETPRHHLRRWALTVQKVVTVAFS